MLYSLSSKPWKMCLGTCSECVVIPLLYKLQYGSILETKEEIEQGRSEVFFKNVLL